MQNFFFKNPLGKFLFDLTVGAVLGAATAAAVLPGDQGAKLAFGAIIGGAIKGMFAAAREGLLWAIGVLQSPPADK